MENSPINLLANNESKDSINLGLPEKTIVPQDLSMDTTDSTSTFKSIFLDKEIKIWVGVFAVVVIIFGLVFYFISKQNSDIESKIAKIDTNTVVNERELPSYFSANLLGQNNDEAPNSNSTQNSNNAPANPTNDDPLAGLDLDGLNFNNEDPSIIDEVEIEPSIDTSDNQSVDTSFLDQIEELPVNNDSELLGSAEFGQDSIGIGLDSNTASEVLMSGELEGDTGPGIWFALIPPFLYGIFRKRK